ncbi:hypothetical protein ACH5RR_007960 [Cinchona calisaya]|uniref:Uncharacterized protein n=1 Tax=Cinchona calisaya TaxID=153742 RepID=A0ABD3ABV1_9GENT
MLSSQILQGLFTRICEEEFDLGSPCIQRTLIDFLNLLMVFVFFLGLIVGLVSKFNVGPRRSDWLTIAISICCALTSIAYFCVGFLNLSDKIGEFKLNYLSWLSCFIRGIIWISLSPSLLVKYLLNFGKH